MLFRSSCSIVTHLAVIGLGVVFVSALAQVKIFLPWTPVPITGQTFGVLSLALLLGRKNALITTGLYLLAGFLGAPIFAGGVGGFSVGPTFGYLVGMLAASIVVGTLADRGWSSRFSTALVATLVGHLLIFGFGLLVLSYFVPRSHLLGAGLWPFLPGAGVKSLLAALIVSRFR